MKTEEKITHFYAFIQKETSPIPFYDRTFAYPDDARRWAEKDPRRFITINSLPPRYWY
jgi:hypothetical protein